MSSAIVPQNYPQLAFGFDEISLGYGGLQLCPPDKIPEWQIGYAVSADGKSLSNGEAGAWLNDWIVFAHEISLGDPIFMDVSQPGYPVSTAMHGEGAWAPRMIAISLDSFFAGLAEFQTLAIGRSSPVELEGNPVGDEARRKFLTKIQRSNSEEIDLEFWDILIGSEEPLDSGAL